MDNYERVIKIEALPIFERAIAKMVAERPGCVELSAVEPDADPGSVKLTIGYQTGVDLFVLGFQVSQEEGGLAHV